MGSETHRVFSLKYRPSTFDELIGQPHVRQTLVNALVRKQVGHGYIFSGPRGVGKTSAARLFAKALNCAEGPGPNICNKCVACREIAAGNSLDVIEMDGASNRKIEDVRALRENVRFAPTSCRNKIYIIDEVHMLTQEAFNALLKTLEEPPDHVVFILATTDPQKIPETIHSRCQELEFHRLSTAQLEELFRHVCKKEKISIDAESVRKLSEWSDGSARDALVALEQAAAFSEGEITEEKADRLFGWVDRQTIENVLDAVMSDDRLAIFSAARQIEESGKDISHFLIQTARTLRQAWIDRLGGKSPEPVSLAGCEPGAMLRMMSLLLDAERSLRMTRQPGLYLAVKLVELIEEKHAVPLSQVVDRLESLEAKMPAGPASRSQTFPSPSHANPSETSSSAVRPPADSSPAQSSGSISSMDSQQIGVIWKKFKESVGADDLQLQAWIRESAPVSCSSSDKVLKIRFSSGFSLHHERITSEKSREILNAHLSRVMGLPGWQVEAELDKKSATTVGQASRDVPARVRVATELFEGKAVRRHE